MATGWQVDSDVEGSYPIPIYYEHAEPINSGSERGRSRGKGRPPRSKRNDNRSLRGLRHASSTDNIKTNEHVGSGNNASRRGRGGRSNSSRRNSGSVDRSHANRQNDGSPNRVSGNFDGEHCNENTGPKVMPLFIRKECHSTERTLGSSGQQIRDDNQENSCDKQATTSRKMVLKKLIMLSKETVNPDTLLLEIMQSKSGFVEMLAEPIDPQKAFYQLRLLSNVTNSTLNSNLLQLWTVVHEKFLLNLTELLNRVSMKETATQCLWDNSDNLHGFLLYVTSLLKTLITAMPSSLPRCKGVITALKEISAEHQGIDSDGSFTASFTEVTEVFKQVNNERNRAVEIPKHSHKVVRDEVSVPPNDFREIEVFPTLNDLQVDTYPYLPKNKTRDKYKDLNEYLDTHFRLLREDYIRPLREGISEYRNHIKGGSTIKKFKLRNMRLYTSAQIVRPVCSGQGVNYILQFDTTNLKKINWTASRRLLFGSLLCLSKDNFDSVKFATIAERRPEDLSKGNIQVRFEQGSLQDVQANDTFIIAESSAYFEAYRYILQGLKEINDTLPFLKYVITCENVGKPPQYLLKQGGPKYNFSCLQQSDAKEVEFPVLNTRAWPKPAELGLDSTQYEAVQRAITKELAIIQGPPGTGKTFVGLKIAELLLKNKHIWVERKHNCPILVVCYTNHALDQFLEGILPVCEGRIVRIGGRCKSDTLQPYLIANVKKTRKEKKIRSFSLMQREKDCRINRSQSEKQISNISGKLKRTYSGIISYTILKEFMTEIQQQSFDRVNNDQMDFSEWLQFYDCHKEETEALTDEEKMKRLWHLFIIESVEELSDSNQVLADMWSIDLYTRAKLYKTWISEFNKAINAILFELAEEKQRSDVDIFESLIEQSKEEILTGDIISLYISNPISKYQIEQVHRATNIPARKHMAVWLRLDGTKEAASEIKDVLENIEEKEICIEPFGNDEDEDLEEDRKLDEDYDDDFRFDYVDTRQQKDRNKTNKVIDHGEWLVKWNERKTAHKVKLILSQAKKLSEEEFKRVRNLWGLSLEQRYEVYAYLMCKYRENLKEQVKMYEEKFNQASEILQEVRDLETIEILQDSDVMGMTTTGAAKYRNILQKVRPKIIIVEEAAEVLESHIITTLTADTQHLILIGDHKQLRPSTTVYELSKKYQMDVSLFERMVVNGIQCVTLEEQHRMRKEISSLLRHPHLYPSLRDHHSVFAYPNVGGIEVNFQFITHTNPEETSPESTSYSNVFEARYLKALCRYLLNQGYSKEKITIITPYMGQVLLLRKEMPKSEFEGVRITAVDNFQGEENDIILLSLVRSSDEISQRQRNPIGFVGIENRICVALSRAKFGLYVMGNFELFARCNEMWADLISDAKNNGSVKNSLLLRCQNHPENSISAGKVDDFANAPNGGCQLACGQQLPCGHLCPRQCHILDQEHKFVTCSKPCAKEVCIYKHKCTRLCSQKCGKCETLVDKVIPMCNHTAKMPCHTNPYKFSCKHECEFQLECGHKCNRVCGYCVGSKTHESRCQTMVERYLPCDHKVKMRCHENVDSIQCQTIVLRSLPCSHMINVPCCKNINSIQCTWQCTATLECLHKCSGTCGKCFGGRIHKECGGGSCSKILPCGHKCSYPCSEICPPCSQTCEVQCSHRKCIKKCWQPCDTCESKCNNRCRHKTCDKLCGEPCESLQCDEPCLKELKCGEDHVCSGLCGEDCVCMICNVARIHLEPNEQLSKDSVLLQLPNCKCIFEINYLDRHFHASGIMARRGDVSLKCPQCKKPIRKYIKRYCNPLKQNRQYIEKRFGEIVGSVEERQKKKVELKQKIEALAQKGLSAVELKLLITQIDNNDHGNLHIFERKYEELVRLLEIRKILQAAESSRLWSLQSIEGTVNVSHLMQLLLSDIKYVRAQFWREIRREIDRLLLATKLKFVQECMHLNGDNDCRLEDVLNKSFKVIAKVEFNVSDKDIIAEVCKTLNSHLNQSKNFDELTKLSDKLSCNLKV